MKKYLLYIFLFSVTLVAGYLLLAPDHWVCIKPEVPVMKRSPEKVPSSLLLPYLAHLQHMKLRNPQTGEIPAGMRSRELDYARTLPRKESTREQNWTWRGPGNIGGRMLCIAIDLEDEQHLLSGSASGGMWQSKDGGQLWQKVTAPDAEQSATCIRQDPRPGKRNIWYYGTGELLSTTDRNISTNIRTVGIGNGIFKTTDNGDTWQPLPFTQGGSPAHLTEIFQGIWEIVVDPVTVDKDIVYAACYGAIMRSEDGGQTWEMVLGDLENKSFGTDIAITSDGVLYAILGSYGWGIEPPGKAGVWRSVDGFEWTNITPEGFPDDNRKSLLEIAPSNEQVVYIFTESQSPDLIPFNGYTNTLNTFWKMTWDPPGDSAIWEERTAGLPAGGDGSINNFPYSFVCYGGYCLMMTVKPDNQDVVMIGGMNLYRSENAFSDSLQTYFMGGYPFDMDSMHGLHPDIHAAAFLPSDPDVLYIANDGGVYITQNCMAPTEEIYWNRMNNMLTTTQFYSVCVDHGSSGDDWILGGLQDNNWYYTVTDDPGELWLDIDICYDGFATWVAPDWEYCVISAYSGNIWTCQFDEDMHAINIYAQLPDTLLKFYDPVMGSNSLFPFYQNFAMDPNNSETFYLPTITSIWRKDNLKAASYDTNLRNTGWNHLSHVDIGDASEITVITVSKNPSNIVFYGTSLGKVYRLDDAHQGDPVPTEITGSGFPFNAFVACIDVDENNADNILVVFSNYEVQSIFATTDGGATWSAQGGNLEEYPDGSGNGPSVRWVKSMRYADAPVWFAGTSAGLYSTTQLDGNATIWKQEGAGSIGTVIIDMIDARQTDGFVAVGTHGNGVYSTWYDPSLGEKESSTTQEFTVGEPYPNPAHYSTTLEIVAERASFVRISLFDPAGNQLAVLFEEPIESGMNRIGLDIGKFSSGAYLLLIYTPDIQITKKIIVIK